MVWGYFLSKNHFGFNYVQTFLPLAPLSDLIYTLLFLLPAFYSNHVDQRLQSAGASLIHKTLSAKKNASSSLFILCIRVLATPGGGRRAHPALIHRTLKLIWSQNTQHSSLKSCKINAISVSKGQLLSGFQIFLYISYKFHPALKFAELEPCYTPSHFESYRFISVSHAGNRLLPLLHTTFTHWFNISLIPDIC